MYEVKNYEVMNEAYILYDKDYSLPKISKATPQSSCYDIYAWQIENHMYPDGEQNWQIQLQFRDRVLIDCGFKLILPQGYEAQIRSRSGLAAKHGIFVLNSPGTIDSDYRGNVKVILICMANVSKTIKQGDRIAQMKLMKYEEPVLLETNEETFNKHQTERGAGGFGSTDRS